MTNRNGLTLIELVIAVSVLAILAGSGMSIFMRSLRTASQVQIRKNLDERARLIINNLSKFMFATKVVSVEGIDRTGCLAAGSINGNSIVLKNYDQLSTTLSIDTGRVASTSGATTSYINDDAIVTVSAHGGADPYFVWSCINGVPDKVTFQFRATVGGDQGDSGYSSDYTTEVVLRNSGN